MESDLWKHRFGSQEVDRSGEGAQHRHAHEFMSTLGNLPQSGLGYFSNG